MRCEHYETMKRFLHFLEINIAINQKVPKMNIFLLDITLNIEACESTIRNSDVVNIAMLASLLRREGR